MEVNKTVGLTVREKLIEVMRERKWYGNTMNPSTARQFKMLVLSGEGVTEDKMREILIALGHKPKTKETW